MKTIDIDTLVLGTLCVAGPGGTATGLVGRMFTPMKMIGNYSPIERTVRLKQAVTNYFLYSAEPVIDPVTGMIQANTKNLTLPEQIAQTRRETPDVTIVCIMPAEDDATTIAKMSYHTYWKSEIQANPESAIALWPELSGKTSDPVLCEAAFMSNVFTKCSPISWIETDMSAADLVIDFKTVMGLDTKDLNQIISDFLGMSRMAEFDTFIQQFRTINQKYLSY
jgi:hypothetical protein